MNTPWLDHAPPPAPLGSQKATGPQPSWTTGVVTEISPGGAWVDMPADKPAANGWGPTDGGITAIGALAQVLLGVDGKIQQICTPTTLPEDAEPVATGVLGKQVQEAGAKAVEAAELTALQAQRIQDVRDDLAQTQADLDLARTHIADVVDPALAAAQGEAAAAAATALEAVTATGELIKAQDTDPGHLEGRLWIQTSGGIPVGVKVSTGQAWISFPLFSEELFVIGPGGLVSIKPGVITTPMLKVTADLWTKILSVAGDASIGGDLLVSGAIKGRHLDIVPATGTGGMKMDAQGFDIIPAGSDGTSSISMRADAEQWLSFAKNGKSTLSLDPEGNATFQQVAVREELTYQGRPLQDILDRAMPSIEVQGWKYSVPSIALSATQPEIQVCRASFVMEPGHMYRAFFRGPTLKTANGSWVECYFRSTTSPYRNSAGQVLAPVQAAKTTTVNPYSMVSESAGEYHTPSTETTVGPASEAQYCSIMVCIRASSAQTYGGADYSAYTFYVQDLGLVGNAAANFAGIWKYSQVYTPPAYQPTNKTGTWGPTDYKNYAANGSLYPNTPSRVIQGTVPGYGGYGNITGWWQLPNLSSPLSGATINDIQIYLANSHTWANAGVTSHLKYDAGGGTTQLMDVTFARGEAKWVSLRASSQWAALAAAIKAGTLGWIGVAGTGSSEYAYFDAASFRIWVSYTS